MTLERTSLRSYAGLCVLVIAVLSCVFIGYEVVERTLLANVSPSLLHNLHLARGIGASLAMAGVVAWYYNRAGAPVLPSMIGLPQWSGDPARNPGDWFIHMRWAAASAAGIVVFLFAQVFGLVPQETLLPLWACVAGILLGNFAFLKVRRRMRSFRSFLLLQVLVDLFLLTCLLHFSGGIENTLYVLYVFHVIIAGILLPREDSYSVTAIAAILFLVMVFGEYFGMFRHYPLSTSLVFSTAGGPMYPAKDLAFVLGVSAAFLSLLAGTAYFVTAIMERLRENQECLLRAERMGALGQMVGFIAHEVNNPVGIILARVKLLRSGEPQFREAKFLEETIEIIDRQANRAGKVTQSLLRSLRSRSVQSAPVDLNTILSDALLAVDGRIRGGRLVVQKNLAPSLPRVVAGYDDLLSAYLNIVGNAIDAMPRGGKLTVSTRRSDGWVESIISDTGEGISPENLGKIFEPLFTTKPPTQGTGLGLPISLSLVRSHKGDIQVESEPGRGASFLVRFPIPSPERPA